MSDLAVTGGRVPWRGRLGTESVPAAEAPDARRALQLGLAGVWLLDALLQYQPVMFTRVFGRMLAATAPGNPGVIAAARTAGAGLLAGAAGAGPRGTSGVVLTPAWILDVLAGVMLAVAGVSAARLAGPGRGGAARSSPTPMSGTC